MTPILQAAAVATLTLGAGAAAFTGMQQGIADPVVPEHPWVTDGALDGLIFHTVDTVLETDETLRDELHFAGGRFQSAMCQEYCDFGWSDYRTWTEGDTVHFTATTRCADAPHTVVWVGQAQGEEITFEATWTTRRWYWTRQIGVTGTGSTTPSSGKALAG